MPETVPTPTTAELVAAIFALLDAGRRSEVGADADSLFAVALWLGAQVKASPIVTERP